MSAKTIITHGTVIHRWTIIGGPVSQNGRSFYQCECACGNRKEVKASALARAGRPGGSMSCGCLVVDMVRKRSIKHGDAPSKDRSKRTRLYVIWQAMLGRCYNKKSRVYENYGARGILVCNDWHSFTLFKEWSIHNGYTDFVTIDRKENDGNYTPQNCRWATVLMQANNKRNNLKIKAFGEEKTLAEWSRDSRCVVSLGTLDSRIRREKWDSERAIATPARSVNQRLQ